MDILQKYKLNPVTHSDHEYDELITTILNAWPSALRSNTQINSDVTYTIGLSGGVDSVVLLHIFKQLQNIIGFKLNAIHVNHHISPNSVAWEEFCIALCNSLNLPLTIFHHLVKKNGGESLENNARKLRYQSFAEYYAQNINQMPMTAAKHNRVAVIVLAHHLDDQIETILSQILRGSDLHNIAAMETISTKSANPQQLFWRPLLNTSKQSILAYAKKYNLHHIEDESNTNTKYLRNFLRSDIIPKLHAWDANITQKLLRYHQQIQQTVSLIDEIAAADLATVSMDTHNNNINNTVENTEQGYYTIDVAKFKQLSFNRQQNLITHFILCHLQPLPSTKQISEFCRQVTNSAWDRQPQLKLSATYSIKKSKNYIFLDTTTSYKQ